MPRTCGLPTVSRCASGCASLQSQPRVHRAACAAPSGCSACDPHLGQLPGHQRPIGAAPDVRPGALQGARHGPGDRGGGAAAGLAGVHPGLRRHGESPKHHDRPTDQRTGDALNRASRWPSAIPVYPFGVGWGSAPDIGAAAPRNRSRPTNPTMSSTSPPPPERGEDRRGGNGHGRGGGVGGGRLNDVPNGPKSEPNGPKGGTNGNNAVRRTDPRASRTGRRASRTRTAVRRTDPGASPMNATRGAPSPQRPPGSRV